MCQAGLLTLQSVASQQPSASGHLEVIYSFGIQKIGVILIMPRFSSVHLPLGDFGQESFNISESYFLICKMSLIVASPMGREIEVLYKMPRLRLDRG